MLFTLWWFWKCKWSRNLLDDLLLLVKQVLRVGPLRQASYLSDALFVYWLLRVTYHKFVFECTIGIVLTMVNLWVVYHLIGIGFLHANILATRRRCTWCLWNFRGSLFGLINFNKATLVHYIWESIELLGLGCSHLSCFRAQRLLLCGLIIAGDILRVLVQMNYIFV